MVGEVTARYVVVRSLDGVEAIVPNETLVTTTVLNHSYSNREIKIGLPVQISYDSDLDLAMKLMEQVALGESRTLRGASTAPLVNVLGFSDNGINLELAVWINDPENGQGNLISAMNVSIWKAFQANGIKIAYPQRESDYWGRAPLLPKPALTGALCNPVVMINILIILHIVHCIRHRTIHRNKTV